MTVALKNRSSNFFKSKLTLRWVHNFCVTKSCQSEFEKEYSATGKLKTMSE